MISTVRCETCRWRDREHESLADVPANLGYCRKHYPIVFPREGRYYASWPLTDVNDFCGEYRGSEEKG